MYEALYLHIPFCKERCAYCDFFTEAVPRDSAKMDAYLETLETDIRRALKRGDLAHIRTIYLGGGTPTHFGHARLVELGYLLSLSIKLEQVQEYTLEANPESLTSQLVNDLFALGTNRLSLGVQSFVDTELALLGRIHTAADAQKALATARGRFENVSLDLMCGIPAQTRESWQYSLEQALALAPEHLSIYPLQIEPNTEFARRSGRGELALPCEDEQAEYLEQASQFLKAKGYRHYEVASYAKPGYESKHNSAYWTGIPYLGLGNGASSMSNAADGTRLRQKNGEEPEYLSAKEARAEDLFLAMRMAQGVSEEQLLENARVLPRAEELFRELQHLGLVEHRAHRYVPTKKGWLLGNELYARIWALANNDER